MHNIFKYITGHRKIVFIWATGLILGGLLALWNNNISQETTTLKKAVETQNNWFIIIPILLVMFSFIPIGYFIGRKLDEDNN